MNLVPLLQAEEDVRYVRARAAKLKDEASVMGAVANWKVGESVYNSDRWVAPMVNK